MPVTVESYSIMISCPSDVEEYLDRIEKSIQRFNSTFGKEHNIVLTPLHYTRDTYANHRKGSSPQGEINSQILDEADMLIGLFWTRFGSPTDKYDSGTEEEIERMLEDDKPVSLYFLDIPIKPSDIRIDQLQRVKLFQDKHKSDGIYWVIQSPEEIQYLLKEQLELRFMQIVNKAQGSSEGNASQPLHSESDVKLVLWVDDNPENNVYERKYFESLGIEVALALNTDQAISYVNSRPVDVIISDMGRHEGPREGYVLLDSLRHNDINTPLVFYANSSAPEDIRETYEHGGQGCTNSPVELFSLVTQLLLG